MKIQGWNMKPIAPKGWTDADGPLSDDIRVEMVVATKDNKRVVLHRVVKRNPDGSEEIFIIKATPQILKTEH
ncbi:MAG TPA: hypothetical protein VKL61_06510 [Candidatus Polarisedimenticolia bacterium]|nr:hypothetical protein [Candidatus Polarisedimenticolia bacterium]